MTDGRSLGSQSDLAEGKTLRRVVAWFAFSEREKRETFTKLRGHA